MYKITATLHVFALEDIKARNVSQGNFCVSQRSHVNTENVRTLNLESEFGLDSLFNMDD